MLFGTILLVIVSVSNKGEIFNVKQKWSHTGFLANHIDTSDNETLLYQPLNITEFFGRNWTVQW